METFPVQVEGEEMFALKDASGLSESIVALSREALFVAWCMDGTRSLEQIREACSRRFGRPVPEENVRSVAEALERALLLDSEEARRRLRQAEREFLEAPSRPSAHAGAAYEGDPEALGEALDVLLEEAARRRPPPLPDGPLVGLIAPHIDMHRGGAGYGAAYLPLREWLRRGAGGPVVILGTAHASPDQLFVATAKAFETPLGPLEVDKTFLRALEERWGGSLRDGELVHRTEHSIEFQAVLLRHLAGREAPAIVPILCSSFHRHVQSGLDPVSDPQVARFVEALRATLAESPGALVIGAADLAHLGPRFGDPDPVAPRVARWCAARDRDCLVRAAGRRPAEFFQEIAAEGDRRRVCGISAIYTALSVLPREARGTLLHYGQALDPRRTTLVSFASIAFTGTGGREDRS